MDEIAGGWPQEVKWLLGFWVNYGVASPRKTLSVRILPHIEAKNATYWSERRRAKTAELVRRIKHWRVIHGDYREAPGIIATWFIDPPYFERRLRRYNETLLDEEYPALAEWCKQRKGQVIVCEVEGATWLSFRPLYENMGANLVQGTNKRTLRRSVEAVWVNDEDDTTASPV